MSSRPEDSRPDDETTLDAWTTPSPEPDPEPSQDDEPVLRPSSGADDQRAALAAIFEDVTGGATFVEEQRETPSHAPVEPGHEAPDLTEDGLGDAADSDLQMGGWI